MTVTDYPEFVKGQTLTADELNSLTDHVVERDRLVGRMTGFGINCGFSGTFVGSTLTIQPGLAVDQRGEPLVLRATRSLSFAPLPTMSTVTFPYITNQADTWSVIARAADTVTPAPPCTEDDCAGHSTTHTTAVVLEVVPGRVSGPRFAFATHPVFAIQPLSLTPTSQPIGDLAAFKAALTAVLLNNGTPLVSTALIAKVNAVSIPNNELAGIKGYKVGWLNMVLFATVDLLRCQALMAIECFRNETAPGVVLGAVHRSGTTWTFDCSLKHFWEPPKGLSQAILGGSCASACGLSKDFLESVLENYDPPVPPPTPPSTGGGGGIIVIDPPLYYCPNGWVRSSTGHCINLQLPQHVIPTLTPEPDGPEIRFHPEWFTDPAERVHAILENHYGVTKLNTLRDGVVVADGLLGHYGANVKVTIEKFVADKGGSPSVTLIRTSDVEAIADYELGGTFSLSDQVFVTVNDAGIASAMGHVPGLAEVRKTGQLGGLARKASVDAAGAVKVVGDFSEAFQEDMLEVKGTLRTLQGSYADLLINVGAMQGTPADHAVLMHRVQTLEQEGIRVDAMGERLSKLEGKALAQVGDLGVKTYTTDVGNGIAEFAQSALQAMKTIEQPRSSNFKEQMAAVERSQAQLEIAVRTGDPATIADSTVGLLDTMRTMIGGAGADAGTKRKLDAQFRAMQELLG